MGLQGLQLLIDLIVKYVPTEVHVLLLFLKI